MMPAADPRKTLSPVTRLLLTGVMLVFLFIAGCMGYLGLKTFLLERAQQSWPTVEATIVSAGTQSSTSEDEQVSWSPVWSYSYTVDGKPYRAQSNGIPGGFDAHWYDSRQEALNSSVSRPVGSAVHAYYDAADPQLSVLDRRTPRATDWAPFGLSILVVLLFGLLIVSGCRAKKVHWRLVD
jgi:hypothetical protein